MAFQCSEEDDRIDKTTDETLDVTRNILKKTTEISEIGEKTMIKLNEQG